VKALFLSSVCFLFIVNGLRAENTPGVPVEAYEFLREREPRPPSVWWYVLKGLLILAAGAGIGWGGTEIVRRRRKEEPNGLHSFLKPYIGREEVAPEELPTEDDVSEPTECLECHKTIPAGSAKCPACGWSYNSS
jgi:hypothetical protein